MAGRPYGYRLENGYIPCICRRGISSRGSRGKGKDRQFKELEVLRGLVEYRYYVLKVSRSYGTEGTHGKHDILCEQ